MRKLYIFSLFIIILISIVTYEIVHPRDYEITYIFKNTKIQERYDKKDQCYYFKIKNNGNEYYYVSRGKYTIKRKLVEDVEVSDSCVTLTVGNYKLGTECIKDGSLVSKSVLNVKTKYEKLDTISGYDIYNDSHRYYVWNSYGVLDILKKNEYNYLDTETYNNSLFYIKDKYLIFVDYDAKRVFKNFYIFDTSNNEYFELVSPIEISFDSYFMGDVKDSVYLFDKKNKNQFEINLSKKVIIQTSNEDSLKYYDHQWKEKRKDEFAFNEIKFKDDIIYDYFIEKDKLFLKLKGNEQNILVSNQKVKDIVKVSGVKVYYMVGNSLFEFNLLDGERKLIEYFEWNFSYLNKIFIID